MLTNKIGVFCLSVLIATVYFSFFVSANSYFTNIYFSVPDSVYYANETMTIKGYVYQTNISDSGVVIANNSLLSGAAVNLTISDLNGTLIAYYNFTSDSNGSFYSKSDYYTDSSVPLVNAPLNSGNYDVKVNYSDLNGNVSFSLVEISVINQTIDSLMVGAMKSTYSPLENISVVVSAIKLVGDKYLYIGNVSVYGSLRNSSSKEILENFLCVTGIDGKCIANVSAPSTYGNYVIEVNNFSSFSSVSVIPFSYNLYMKDELGKSYKNIFSLGESASVQVSINNASSSDEYNFSGYITDSSGNNIQTISTTALNNANYFANAFVFELDSDFSYGVYIAHVTVSKSGESIESTASFQVEDWGISMTKKSSDSGFEYEYSAFANKTLSLELYPTFRLNGSVIPGLADSNFSVNLRDNMDNIVETANASWNSSCGKSGCYEFSINASSSAGKYVLSAKLTNGNNVRIVTQVINIISGVLIAQTGDTDGNVKELFGIGEYAYISLSAYNDTAYYNLRKEFH